MGFVSLKLDAILAWYNKERSKPAYNLCTFFIQSPNIDRLWAQLIVNKQTNKKLFICVNSMKEFKMENKVNELNIQPFDGKKYTVWKFCVKLLLPELSVRDVVDSDPPSDISDEWHKNDSTAKSVIVEYLGDSFLSFAKQNTTAREIFQNLYAIYD